MTLFAATLRLLGLSQQDAAHLLDARIDTIKSWASGRNGVPEGVWDELRTFYAGQLAAAARASKKANPLALPLPAKDHHSASTDMAVLARVAMETDIPLS
ncbi:hypothetical protein [Pyruvatibacter sp.]